tara:strand:- start:630 stop:1298 length:669 start_codon:yes stop_codon:yes gene_type:complete
MSFKSFLQILVICLIFTIIGTVYLLYFNKNTDFVKSKSDKITTEKEISNNTNNQGIIELEAKKDEEDKKNNSDQVQQQDKKNVLNEIEYIGTDKKGNKYKIFAKSGTTNKDDGSLLDLIDVRGIVSSNQRPNIYIVSDFAIYNSSNLNSNFYQNVIINYEDKQIDCDFFDLNMKTNFATAYGNVIVTDPTSIMRSGKINLNLDTKDIEITPEEKNKVKVLTN